MKYLALLTALFVFASAETQTMTPSQHNSIQGYNNKPTLKSKTKQKMHKMHNVEDDEARQIIKKETGEDVEKLKLTHSGNYLIYRASTKSYHIQVNALDGKVMKKELKK